MRCHYRLQLIGGPYDGAPGLHFHSEPELDLPELIKVGVCPGRGVCGMGACTRNVGRHVAFWLEDEGEPPVRTEDYRKANELVFEPADEDDEPEEHRGEARYVWGEAELPGALADDIGALAGAGAFGGLTYG